MFLLLSGHPLAQKAKKLDLAFSLQPLESPAAPGSGEPNLFTGPDKVVYLSWIERANPGHALRFATYSPGAKSWSAAHTIVEGENWFVNWADFPSLAVGQDGNLVAHWLARSGKDTYAYSVYVRHSSDGGKTWSPSRTLHDDTTQTEHGFVSLLPIADTGTTLAVWVDGRKFAEGQRDMTLRARMIRADGSFAPEMLVDGRICECCQTSAVRLPGGKALVAYRDRSAEEVRDIYVARYENGTWSAPMVVHNDGWKIRSCPVNGPSLDALGERVVVAWFTGAESTPRVRVAFTSDGGRTFAKPIQVDRGKPVGRVDAVMLDDGSAVVSWVESEEGENQAAFLVRRVARSGAMSEPVRIEDTTSARASGFPRVARSGSHLIFAWTEAGNPSRVRTAVAELR
jgi:hypothetical protein